MLFFFNKKVESYFIDANLLLSETIIQAILYFWQDTDKVLGMFGDKTGSARHTYRAFVEKGITLGKRPDLTGGGIVRSAVGWTAVKAL